MKIVSLAGGGCFGYVQAQTLHLSAMSGLLDQVDVWAGTSAGGAIALAMAAGIAPSKVAVFFREFAPAVFHHRAWNNSLMRAAFAPKYPGDALDKHLKALFGNMTMGQLKKPALITTHNLTEGQPEDLWSPNEPTMLVWHAARMTCAAHTFLASFMGRADGGLHNNDPALKAVAVMSRYRLAKLSEISLFCLGSGAYVVRRKVQDCNPRMKTAWLKMILTDTTQGAGVYERRRDARDLLQGHGGRYDSYEFPHSDLDFDDPAAIAMIDRDWMGHCIKADIRMTEFFVPRG